MTFGIANLGLVPVRKERSERSEMVTQLLFGEHFRIIEEEGSWFKVIICHDNYPGWVDKKLCRIISEGTFDLLQNKHQTVSTEITNNIFLSSTDIPLRITIGSTLPFLDKKSNLFSIEDEKYRFDGMFSKFYKKNNRENVIKIALSMLNTPYFWGGKSPFGIDCSGLIQVIYKVTGISLPRDADQQINIGLAVNHLDISQTGDLAFFENEDGRIIHVGLVYEKNKIIHCSGKVRIDKLDNNGIYSNDYKKYTHTLNSIRNVIDPN